VKEACKMKVTGIYPAGGDEHWLSGFWYGHMEVGKMLISIAEHSAYTKFSEKWMPDGDTAGVIVRVPIKFVRLTCQEG